MRYWLALLLLATLPSAVALGGDLNNDGYVNVQDLLSVTQHIGRSKQYHAASDLNGDGSVNIFDLTRVSRDWGRDYWLAAPSRSSLSPSGQLPAGAGTAQLQLTTNVSADCSYSTASNQPFSSMTPFTSTGGTSHSSSVAVQDGRSYTYYVKCSDAEGRISRSDETIAFSVLAASVASVIPSGSTRIFFDDFEAGNLNRWDNTDPRYTLSTSRARNGTYSVEVLTTATDGSGELNTWFMPGYDELYFTFDVQYDTGYLGGMHMANIVGNRIDDMWSAHGQAGTSPDGTDFFAITVDPDNYGGNSGPNGGPGPFLFYVYFPDMSCAGGCWGNLIRQSGTPSATVPGQWQNVVVHVKLNTPGQTDSQVRMWIDGELKIDQQGTRWRDTTDLRLNEFALHAYSGSPPQLQRVWFDNVEVWQPPAGTTPDTTPPLRSNGQPSSPLPAGTTGTTVSLSTDEAATCRLSPAAGTAYAAMAYAFSGAGTTSHTYTIPQGSLANGQSYTLYVRCIDSAGNVNVNDYPIQFSVANPVSTCGNGVVDGGEQCDTGAARGSCPAACSLSCTTNSCGVCGDGVVNSGEQCDTGAQRGSCPAACSLSCTTNSCGGSVIFSDDFEMSGWTRAAAGWDTDWHIEDIATVSSLPGGRAGRAARFAYNANANADDNVALTLNAGTLPLGIDHYFIRGYLYMPSAPTVGQQLMQRKLLYLTNHGSPGYNLVLGVYGGTTSPPSWYVPGEIAGSSYAGWTTARTPNLYDNWHYVELEVQLNTPGQSDGVLRLWVDDPDTPVLVQMNKDLRGNSPEGFDEIMVGQQLQGDSNSLSEYRYWDDFVVSTQRIGPEMSAPDYPNLPAGLSPIARNDGSVKEANGDAFGIADFGAWSAGNDITVVADPTNPSGSGSSLRFTYGTDADAGTATANTFTGGPYRELYVMTRMYLEPGYHDEAGGKFFYLGAAPGQRLNTGSPTQFYNTGDFGRFRLTNQNGGSENVVDSGRAPPIGTNTNPLPTGQWLDMEHYLVASSAPNVADGEAYLYVNGQLVGYNTAIDWDTTGFTGMEWYAHFSGTLTAPRSYRLGELYIAGR